MGVVELDRVILSDIEKDKRKSRNPLRITGCAEKEGFEPSHPYTESTPLAGEHTMQENQRSNGLLGVVKG